GRAALLFIDLDGFKEVNDRLGHAQGDQVLVMVANRLRIVLQAETGSNPWQPLLARLAGDEFTMLLPGVDRGEAERIAGRAVQALSEPFGSGAAATWLGASIGIALSPEHGEELTPLMKAADIAMYHAKASGRSRTCVYHEDLALASAERAGSDAAFRAAVAERRLKLLFDPQLCLRTGAITGAEARVLWEEGGRLRPLPAFDDRGLAQAIGAWTLAEAGEVLAEWRNVKLPHRLSLRLDADQLQSAETLARLKDLAGPVEIEIPESFLGYCPPHVAAALAELREAGVSAAVADFGGGAAPLASLVALPVERVKLAPALVEAVDRSERGRALLSSTVHLVRSLGADAIATGVERQEQLEVLRAVGCGTVQGFLGIEPMDGAAFAVWAVSQDCAHSLAKAS
ncbi:MAG: hypothetical protein QOH86_2185, partial [Sphingomonadales bacterium]|nr:hypothetical protein [Sphingomonadales bacterium]